METNKAENPVLKIAHQAPLSCALAATCLLGMVLYNFSFSQGWALPGDAITRPTQWYKFITYSIIHMGVIHWVFNAVWLVVVGLFIERRIKRKFIAVLIISSAVVGGVVFCIKSPSYSSIIGSGLILNAYIGCLFACYLADSSSFSKWARIATGVLLVLRAITFVTGIFSYNRHEQSFATTKDIVLIIFLILSRLFYKHIIIDNEANQNTHSVAASGGSE